MHRLLVLHRDMSGGRHRCAEARAGKDDRVTQPPLHPIEAESYSIMASRVDLSTWAEGPRQVVARMIHATADESFAESALIGAQAVEAAIRALKAAAPVVCDSKMVAAGVPRVASMTSVLCYLDRVPTPPLPGTRSAAAIEVAAGEHPDGAVWVIGNAPTALARLVGLCQAGALRPALVIGLPVGYVGAAEAKEELWASELRDLSVTNRGPRGGSPVAAAALNSLARLASGRG
jgi:precorrin-8X/cobalt-precorrin-8 methylmutase